MKGRLIGLVVDVRQTSMGLSNAGILAGSNPHATVLCGSQTPS